MKVVLVTEQLYGYRVDHTLYGYLSNIALESGIIHRLPSVLYNLIIDFCLLRGSSSHVNRKWRLKCLKIGSLRIRIKGGELGS